MITFVTSFVNSRDDARLVEDCLRRHTDQIVRLGMGRYYFAGVLDLPIADTDALAWTVNRDLTANGLPYPIQIAFASA